MKEQIAILMAKGWSFGVPIFFVGHEYVAEKGSLRIVGRGRTNEEAQQSCVKQALEAEEGMSHVDAVD